MGFPVLWFIFTLCINYSFQYALEPLIEWPSEYHFKGEEIDLIAGIVKPFEIWYSAELNKSRIDLYGGNVKRYYDGTASNSDDEYDYNIYEHFSATKVYMFHPEYSQEEQKSSLKCSIDLDFDDFPDFLPSLEDFSLKGHQTLDGNRAQLWYKNTEDDEKSKVVEEILMYEQDGMVIPVRHTKQKFKKEEGAIKSHEVVNYYNFNSKVSSKDLEVDEDEVDCKNPFNDVEYKKALHMLHPSIPSDVNHAFKRFKTHHKKNYKENEHKKRKQIFRENWKLVKETNEKNLGYKLGVNEYADKTLEELRYLTGIIGSGPPIRGSKPFPYTEEKLKAIETNLPDEYDLRAEGVIPPVRNQARCGSCWAFAATATVEGAFARANGGRVMDLSEQSLVDCAWGYSSYGCQGTMVIGDVFRYLENNGIPTVKDYGPYLEEDGICNINNMTDVVNIKGFVAVTPYSEAALKAAIYEHGPVTIGIQVTMAMFMYESGIFYGTECVPDAQNHAVALVGYGYKNGELFWIIKNSYGENWGADGYLYISAKNNNCNVMTSPYYVVM